MITTIEIAQMDEKRANRIKEKINGKTYMKFEVCDAPMPGGRFVSISTSYEAPKDEIVSMLLYVLATSL